MKTITIVIPTYNEEDNILYAYQTVCQLFAEKLPQYRLQFLFADNGSTDRTRSIIRSLCERDKLVGAIFNTTNVGYSRSSFHALRQAGGDAVVLLSADLQEPPDTIPEFVKQWENGHAVVCGVKVSSEENPLIFFLRQRYYDFMKKMGNSNHIPQFNGFGLYDKSFINSLRDVNDFSPYLRGIVSEFGADIVCVEYRQRCRQHGKSYYRFWGLYDFAMLGLTSCSNGLIRMCTLASFLVGICAFLIALSTLIIKLLNWDTFQLGIAALITGMFFIGAIQLFFIGILGEYIMSINTRVMRHPLVVEKERINLSLPAEELPEEK